MPFIKIASKSQGLLVGLWRIEENEAFFLSRLSLYENELAHLNSIKHASKRLEWLSSRLCLKTLIDLKNKKVESLKDAEGKPYLSDNSYHISYSHSKTYAAAVASTFNSVAVDIELFSKKRRPDVSKMFMDEWELAFFNKTQDMHLFMLIWSAKETLFKAQGKHGISFRENIHINVEDFSLKQNGIISGCVQTEDYEKHYEIFYEIFSGFVLTYTMDSLLQQYAQRG